MRALETNRSGGSHYKSNDSQMSEKGKEEERKKRNPKTKKSAKGQPTLAAERSAQPQAAGSSAATWTLRRAAMQGGAEPMCRKIQIFRSKSLAGKFEIPCRSPQQPAGPNLASIFCFNAVAACCLGTGSVACVRGRGTSRPARQETMGKRRRR